MRIALALLVALSACRAAHEAHPTSATVDAGPAWAPDPHALDLLHAEHVSVDLDLSATAQRAVNVPPDRDVVFKLTHQAGPVGKLELVLRDTVDQPIPVSDDDMTCVEPGCSVTVEVASAPRPRTLHATCTGSTAMSARLEVSLAPPKPPTR